MPAFPFRRHVTEMQRLVGGTLDVCNGVIVPRKEEQLASATDCLGDIAGHFLDENRGRDT